MVVATDAIDHADAPAVQADCECIQVFSIKAGRGLGSNSASACTIQCPEPEDGSSRSSKATSTTTRYWQTSRVWVFRDGFACALVAYFSPPEPETPGHLDAHPRIGSAMASSTANAPSLP
jgi:hypothetical protein